MRLLNNIYNRLKSLLSMLDSYTKGKLQVRNMLRVVNPDSRHVYNYNDDAYCNFR